MHYFAPQRFGNTIQEESESKFITQQYRNKLKNEYCRDNGYLLLCIRNNLPDKELKKIITNFIKDNLVY